MPKQPPLRGVEPVRAGLGAGIGAVLFVAVLFASVLWPDAPVAISESWRAKPVKVARSTVLLEWPEGLGTGIYLGNGYILTAAHNLVGHDPAQIEITTEDGPVAHDKGADVMWINPRFDLGLIRQRAVSAQPADLSCRSTTVGESVTVEGYPLGIGFVRTQGHVGSDPTDKLKGKWQSVFELDAAVAPGNSGGPVYDKDGKVIGIVVGMTSIAMGDEYAPMSFAVPSSVACMLLAKDETHE